MPQDLPRRGPALRRHLLPVLIDGLPLPELGYQHEALVDGDALCYSIAAAGIVAKTVRDRLMRRLAVRHPGYGWEHNIGYGTAEHCDAIDSPGPHRHHRTDFRSGCPDRALLRRLLTSLVNRFLIGSKSFRGTSP